MCELADIFRLYGPSYQARFGDRMLPSHLRAMRDIEQCRTEALGGQVYHCPDCNKTRYRYHSCQNRHCPKCQYGAGEEWLARQQDLLLPVPYFMLTFTLPEGLRQLARSHQKQFYNLLFRTSAAATQELARDPRFVGAQIGMIGVLQTWARNMVYHPHVHYLVPAGGLSLETGEWRRVRNHFLIHVKPLSILYRAKFRDALRQTNLYEQVPAHVWRQAWVVHCQPVGNGRGALTYLAPYIFRIAISNRRILKLQDGKVTFSYKDSDTNKRRYSSLRVHEFMRRLLQHVLPKGFVKVRYYGFFSPGKRHLLHQITQLLHVVIKSNSPPDPTVTTLHSSVLCPSCGREMRLVQTIRPRSRCPPKMGII